MNSTSYYRNPITAILLTLLITGCMESSVDVLKVGTKAPPFTLGLVDGKQVSLADYSGKSLAITFMASWCPCSKDSIPFFKQAYSDHKDVQFLMVGTQDAESKFNKFVQKWEVPFPSGYDSEKVIARNYGVSAPPTTIFIDKTGTVKRVFYGNIKDKQKEFPQWLEEIL